MSLGDKQGHNANGGWQMISTGAVGVLERQDFPTNQKTRLVRVFFLVERKQFSKKNLLMSDTNMGVI